MPPRPATRGAKSTSLAPQRGKKGIAKAPTAAKKVTKKATTRTAKAAATTAAAAKPAPSHTLPRLQSSRPSQLGAGIDTKMTEFQLLVDENIKKINNAAQKPETLCRRLIDEFEAQAGQEASDELLDKVKAMIREAREQAKVAAAHHERDAAALAATAVTLQAGLEDALPRVQRASHELQKKASEAAARVKRTKEALRGVGGVGGVGGGGASRASAVASRAAAQPKKKKAANK